MKTLRFIASYIVVCIVIGCSGNQPELPDTFYIAQGSNLYEATAFLCKGNVEDEKGRGRWRRWANDNEAIAYATTRWNPRSGTTVIIQANDYTVPRNLCADEAGFPWWLVLLLVGAAGTVGVIFALVRRSARAELATDQDFGIPSSW